MEIAKIDLLRSELAKTVRELEREGANFDRKMPAVIKELEGISDSVDGLISPKLSKLRASYSEFADKRGEVREALTLYSTVMDIERRRADLERGVEAEKADALSNADVPTTVAHNFAKTVETILAGWHFPEAGDVYFDSKSRDLVIAGSRAAHLARVFAQLRMQRSHLVYWLSAVRAKRLTLDSSYSIRLC